MALKGRRRHASFQGRGILGSSVVGVGTAEFSKEEGSPKNQAISRGWEVEQGGPFSQPGERGQHWQWQQGWTQTPAGTGEEVMLYNGHPESPLPTEWARSPLNHCPVE